MLVFISGTAIMIAVMEGPLRPVDYFTAGVIGTLLALAALFLSCVKLSKVRDVFYKKRPVKTLSEGRGSIN